MNYLQKISGWYFTKKALPYWCVLVLDCAIVALCGLLASYLEHGGLSIVNHFFPISFGLVCCLPLFAISFHLFHTYQGVIRFSSYVDLFRIAKASIMGGVFSYLLGRLVGFFVDDVIILFPDVHSLLIMVGISTLGIWVVRMMVKASFEVYRTDNAIPVAIYGTKAGGISLANSIKSVKEKQFILRAFISDGREMAGSYLMGQRVYLNTSGLAQTLKENGVKGVLVSPLKTELLRKNQTMVDELIRTGLKIFIMPAAEEWDGKSNLSFTQLHEIEIEDLLPRDKIEVDMEAIGTMLTGKCILITGAAGSIGSEISQQVAQFAPSGLVLIDQAETPMHNVRLFMQKHHSQLKVWTVVGSITNEKLMEQIFAEHQPDYVFHAAAYKHVPMMEDNPAIAVQNNIYGTRVIADLAVKYHTKKFVMISTDKAVNPTNVMGCSKRICEIYCQSLNQAIVEGKVKGITQFVTTRFGNVLGSNGSVIPLFRKQIHEGGPVTVTHPDIIRYFMLIPEACKLVLEAGTMGKGGEIFVFDMGEPVRIVDLAQRMITLSHAQNVKIEFTGLREGEKLYEEVLNDKEDSIPTIHPKIMVAKVREYDYAVACANEERLLEASNTFDDMAIVRVMKEIVPEYKSMASKYNVLDK